MLTLFILLTMLIYLSVVSTVSREKNGVLHKSMMLLILSLNPNYENNNDNYYTII